MHQRLTRVALERLLPCVDQLIADLTIIADLTTAWSYADLHRHCQLRNTTSQLALSVFLQRAAMPHCNARIASAVLATAIPSAVVCGAVCGGLRFSDLPMIRCLVYMDMSKYLFSVYFRSLLNDGVR